MNCSACGKAMPEGARVCPACGHEASLSQRTAEGSKAVAHDTGEVVGKVGKGLLGGAKAFGSGVKKGFRDSKDEEKKE